MTSRGLKDGEMTRFSVASVVLLCLPLVSSFAVQPLRLGSQTFNLAPQHVSPMVTRPPLIPRPKPTSKAAAISMQSNERNKISISSGKWGVRGVNLGVRLTEALKRKHLQGICLETKLRQAQAKIQECRLDDIYGTEPLTYTDSDALAWHAASGMRVASGCPMRLLYGVKGGCEACKCRVPGMQEVKKYCPYYGSGGQKLAPKTGWDLRQAVQHVFAMSAALVVISGSEDLSAAPDIPIHKEIFTYQKELIDTAKRSGVDNLLIIGPSDDAPGSQSAIAAKIKEQQKLTQKMGLLHNAQQFFQVDGLEIDNHAQLPKLLAEKYMQEQGIMYNSIRAPTELFNSAALAVVAAQILKSGQSNKHVIVGGSAAGITVEDEL